MTIVAMCDSYAGVDLAIDVEFKGMVNFPFFRLLMAVYGLRRRGTAVSFWMSMDAFAVYTAEEKPREVFVHPEDVKLDEEPTLFQQMLGEFRQLYLSA